MPRRGKRPKGERRHGNRIEVYVRIHGDLRRTSFPLTSTPEQREAWRIAQQAAPAPPPRGSIARDAVLYLRSVQHTPDYSNKRTYLNRWIAALGRTTPRTDVTSQQIATVLSQWQLGGMAPTTARHHRTALKHLYDFHGQRGDANPVTATPRPRDPEPEARAANLAHVRKVLAHLRPSKTRARLKVILTTGLPHAQVMQLTPADWDRPRRMLTVRRRKKGGGVAGRLLPLSDEAMAALREFAQWDAWGSFSASTMYWTVTHACTTLGLPRFRPYDLRHLHGALIYAATGDLSTTARLLGHAGTKTTERYANTAFALVDAAAVSKVGRKLAAAVGKPRKRTKKRTS